jgi:hypothetical protein
LERVLSLQVGGLVLPPVTELFFKLVTGSEMVDRIHMSLNAKFLGSNPPAAGCYAK